MNSLAQHLIATSSAWLWESSKVWMRTGSRLLWVQVVAGVFSLPGVWKIDHTVCLLLLRQTESTAVVDFSEINPHVHFFICTVHSALKSSCCLCMNREGETNPVYRFNAPEITSVGRVSEFKVFWYVLCNLPHVNFLFRWLQNITCQHKCLHRCEWMVFCSNFSPSEPVNTGKERLDIVVY